MVLDIRILNLPALLSRFRVTSGLMYHDPSGKSKVIDFGRNYLTPLLHKDTVESTAYPHQKAVSTFLPPAQAPPQLPARRVLQLGERGFCPGGRASWPGGRITSKGHSWIDPGDDIDLTAIPLWVRVGFTPLEIPVVATRN